MSLKLNGDKNFINDTVKNETFNYGFKKTCKQNACSTNPTSENFNQQIKSKILEKTRELSIKESKK